MFLTRSYLLLTLLSGAYAQALQVKTTEGLVVGFKAADGDYYAFYDVPYGGITTGFHRFKAPMPPLQRSRVFAATESHVICAQPTAQGLIGVENCLTLSVFTKNVTTPKPVIVWLNAEEYTTTYTQSFSYRSFIDEDIVFVTLNFRLSIFGFLCLGVKEAPGNAGLKDVIQGLKWIQANIANFGGDPNNVVLMGHGSGAAMVDLLTLSPQTEKLVHKAIALSGSGLAPWAVSYDPIGYAKLLGDQLGYSGKTPTQLARRLVETNTIVLNTALNDFKFQNNTPLFAPCIENPKLKGAVLTDDSFNVLKSGKYAQIPYIYGYATAEGTLKVEEAVFGNWRTEMQANFTNFLQVDLQFGKNTTAVTRSVRNFYFGSAPISKATIQNYLDYEGDTLVVVSTIRAAKERALTSKAEVRLFEFGYLGTLNSDRIYNQIHVNGALLNYLFDYGLRPVDKAVSKSLVRRLTRFAYNWNTTMAAGARNSVAWTPINNVTTNYLYYGNKEGTAKNTSMYVEEPRFNPHVQQMSFWDNLYAKYYVAPKSPNSSSANFVCIFFVALCQLFVRLI